MILDWAKNNIFTQFTASAFTWSSTESPFEPFGAKNVDIMPGWSDSASSSIGSTGSADVSPGWDNAAKIKENFPC